MRQASTVLPRPTSSASSQRTGSSARGALGHVELVGEEPDAAAQERAEAFRLAGRGQVERVEAQREVLDRIQVARGEPLQHLVLVHRPQLVQAGLGAVAQEGAAVRRGGASSRASMPLGRRRTRWPGRSSRRARAGESAASRSRVPRDRELDLQRAPRDRDHAPRPEPRVLPMPQPVAGLPHAAIVSRLRAARGRSGNEDARPR